RGHTLHAPAVEAIEVLERGPVTRAAAGEERRVRRRGRRLTDGKQDGLQGPIHAAYRRDLVHAARRRDLVYAARRRDLIDSARRPDHRWFSGWSNSLLSRPFRREGGGKSLAGQVAAPSPTRSRCPVRPPRPNGLARVA